jgi:hypothetical protein
VVLPVFVEQRRFLGAGDDHRTAGVECFEKAVDLAPAQLVGHRAGSDAAQLCRGIAVQRHGAFAGADENGAAVGFHSALNFRTR